MRVLYFMNHADCGGAALALYDLIYEIKKDVDIEPIVITGKKNKLNKMLTDIGVENYTAPFKNFMSTYKKPKCIYILLLKLRYKIGQYFAIKKIERIIDFSTIDIIHSNLNRIDIGAIFAKKYNIPHIWHIREHADGRDFKLVSVVKNPILYMNSFDSYIIVISNSVKKAWIEKGLSRKRQYMIYDGIRSEMYKSLNKKNNLKLRAIFLGGYTISKGQEYLIDELCGLPEEMKDKIEIDFFGNGNDKYINYLRNKIRINQLSKVMTLHSYQYNIWEKVPNYDVGFTCSRVEGFGRVTIEYMMSGLCPIVSNGGASPEIVENGVNGIVYDLHKKGELLKKVMWAIDNKEKIISMGVEAEKFSKKSYSMREHAQKVKDLYLEVLEKNE